MHDTPRCGIAILAGMLLVACGGRDGPTQPAAPDHLVFVVQPSPTPSTQAIAPAVQVALVDASGKTVTTATTTVTVAIGTNVGGGTLSGTTMVAPASGVATFSTLSIDKTGTGYTLVASAGTLTGATSAAFNITPGAVSAAQSTVGAAPASVLAGSASSTVTVTARDGAGNAIGGATVVLAATGTGNTLTQPPGPTNPSGVASGTLSSTVAETKTISATINGTAITQEATVAVTPGAATEFAFTVQPSHTAADALITPAVRVTARDASGNTATGFTGTVTVAIETNPSGGTLAGTRTVNAAGGITLFGDLKIDRPGRGYTLTASSGALTVASSTPFDVVLPFVAVSAGGFHTCGVTTSGAAYCWGFNLDGRLGNGTTTNSATPLAVAGTLTFAMVSAGYGHSCGVTTGGDAYCWGANANGELGNGTTTNSATPVAVAGGYSFALVSAGYYHTCGVTTTGPAYCWGQNGEGALGDGTLMTSTTPVAVAGMHSFAGVSGGYQATCGVTTTGAAYCWGYNGWGELGDGTTTRRTAPVAVVGGPFGTVSIGYDHTCGVTTSGTAYCWGFNSVGQLGNGTTTSSTTPVAVTGGLTFTAGAVSAGYYHACGVTTTGGGAYCWGANASGQLGNGTTTSSATPRMIEGGLSSAGVSAAGSHTCGVTATTIAYCWGDNVYGQLGNGTTGGASSVPAHVVP